jgi:Zinc carboxypeptidase
MLIQSAGGCVSRLNLAWGAVAIAMLLASDAAASSPPVALPTVARAMTVAKPVRQTCSRTAAGARGTAVSSYRAPESGYLSARLAGPDTSDWDLVLRDAYNRILATSESFGSHEVTQTWVHAGDRVVAQGCRQSGRASRVPLTFNLVAADLPTPGPAPALLRVQGTPAQLSTLDSLGPDVTENRGLGWADVLVSGASQLALINRAGLKHTTRIANMQTQATQSQAADARYAASVNGVSPLPSGRTTYRTYDDIQTELKALVENHPGRVRKVVIGTSYQGRELSGIEIANNVNATGDGRPIYLVLALHHAREWPSAEAAMEYATMLANSNGSDPRIAGLLKNERTVVIPLVNPDGFVSTQAAEPIDPADAIRDPSTGGEQSVQGIPPSTVESIAPPGGILSYRRKNCAGAIPNPNVPCELQWGVDPNRNYGQLWGGLGASPDPTSQAYHGPGPFSEPETQAVRDYTRTHQVTALITLHNVAALVLRPPGLHDGGLAPDETRMKQLGDAMAADAGYTSEFGFQLYDTAGTTEDYTYAAQGGYGFTIEIGPPNGSFHMPYQVGFVDEWTGNGAHGAIPGKGLREALLTAGDSAMNLADHGVIQGTAKPGATLRIRQTFDTVTSAYCKIGVDPPLTVFGGPICAPGQTGGPDSSADFFQSTLVVPGSGSFTWQVDPSTRPFVGGGAVKYSVDATPYQTDPIVGKAGDTTWPPPDPTGAGTHKDYPFTVNAADQVVEVRTSPDVQGEDYDLEVWRCGSTCGGPNDKLVGSSGQPSGMDNELVTLTPATAPPGAYYARVINYLGPSSTYHGSIAHFAGHTVVTTGHKEAYTMTCEVGGNVVDSQQVIVGRGQTADVSLCGNSAQGTSGSNQQGSTPVVIAGAPQHGVAGAKQKGRTVRPATCRTVVRAPARRHGKARGASVSKRCTTIRHTKKARPKHRRKH